ncbi:uncharacterized protein LOC116127601 [Pistacia vera]|uniref:uncharacterized protein LOC116127601 n=1 Tax=Pistacia vera TaxID=55513 RepID=UPI001263BCBC|nr:uncharacterized protein LOC116127601 [Pistacia vera]
MEICKLPARFSGIPLQFSAVARTPGHTRARRSTIFRCSTVTAAFSSSQTYKLERSQGKMFILGMGFVGQIFAQELKNEGWVVSGTCTTDMKKEELQERGFDVYLFNANELELRILDSLKHYSHLLVSIPPVVGVGDPMLQHAELLRSTLVDGHLQWLGYLSSTGVYGHCGGVWVDEDYQASPTTELGKFRLAAEERWLNLAHDIGLSSQVFRLGGIYGPGRSAVDTIVRQVPLSESQKLRSSRKYTSRIHVDDICQVLKASIHKPSSGNIYNVVDDYPAPREEVFAYALDLVEEKWPGRFKQRTSVEEAEPFCTRGSSRGEKRVSNARIKKELSVRLLHPSYKSGLRSIIDQMEKPYQSSLLCS